MTTDAQTVSLYHPKWTAAQRAAQDIGTDNYLSALARLEAGGWRKRALKGYQRTAFDVVQALANRPPQAPVSTVLEWIVRHSPRDADRRGRDRRREYARKAIANLIDEGWLYYRPRVEPAPDDVVCVAYVDDSLFELEEE